MAARCCTVELLQQQDDEGERCGSASRTSLRQRLSLAASRSGESKRRQSNGAQHSGGYWQRSCTEARLRDEAGVLAEGHRASPFIGHGTCHSVSCTPRRTWRRRNTAARAAATGVGWIGPKGQVRPILGWGSQQGTEDGHTRPKWVEILGADLARYG